MLHGERQELLLQPLDVWVGPNSSAKPRAITSNTPGTPLLRVACRWARYWFRSEETRLIVSALVGLLA